MIDIQVKLSFDTPPNIGSGAQVGTLADRAFIKDRHGWPFIPATTIKGLLRHAVERVVRGMGQESCDTHHDMCREKKKACPVCAIFGSSWIPGRLRFEDLKLIGPEEVVDHLNRLLRKKQRPRTDWRYGVALSRRRRVAEDALLYTTELFMPGVSLSFGGGLTGPIDEEKAALVVAGLQLLPAMGRAKSAGLGHMKAKAEVKLDGQVLDRARLRAALEGVES